MRFQSVAANCLQRNRGHLFVLLNSEQSEHSELRNGHDVINISLLIQAFLKLFVRRGLSVHMD